MNNGIYSVLLEEITANADDFKKLIELDNPLGLGPSYDDIIEYMEFTNIDTVLKGDSFNQVIITEGDVLSTLKIIHDLTFYEGNFILFINDDNKAINTFLVEIANQIYRDYEINVKIKLDYSENYNDYLEVPVTLIGSEDFVNTAGKDFENCNKIEV